jgi:hypothetical protein
VIKILLKSLAPALEEKIAARQMHKTRWCRRRPAADSPGAVREPVEEGRDVSGGRRKAS